MCVYDRANVLGVLLLHKPGHDSIVFDAAQQRRKTAAVIEIRNDAAH